MTARLGRHPRGVSRPLGSHWARFDCKDCTGSCCSTVLTISRPEEVENDYEHFALECLGGLPGGSVRYVHCRRCDLIYMDPALNPDGQAAFFDAMYRRGVGSVAAPNLVRVEQRRLKRIARFLRPPGRLLDIGCGTGTFAAVAAENGWEAWGHEISPAGYAAAQTRLHDRVLTGPLSALPSGWADCVTLFSVVEHTTDPVAVLQDAARICRPGGLVVFNVPNAGSLEARVSMALRATWLGFNLSHVWSWTDRSVRALAAQAAIVPCAVESRLPLFSLRSERGCENLNGPMPSGAHPPVRRLRRFVDPAFWWRLRILLNAPFDGSVLGERVRLGSYLFVYARREQLPPRNPTHP